MYSPTEVEARNALFIELLSVFETRLEKLSALNSKAAKVIAEKYNNAVEVLKASYKFDLEFPADIPEDSFNHHPAQAREESELQNI